MEENNNNHIKINLVTIILIVVLVIVTIIGLVVYILYYNNNTKSSGNTNSISSDITSNYVFELDSKNKYIITTDSKWMTMQDDGGSNTSVYFQIDLDNNIVSKISEYYRANLTSSPTTQKTVLYSKKIDSNLHQELQSLLNRLLTEVDVNETHNYFSYTIDTFNTNKSIYNINSINNIKSTLLKLDNLNS